MELREMIRKLIESEIIENKELGTTLLIAHESSDEELIKYIDKFVSDYKSGKLDFSKEEHKNLINLFLELYNSKIEYIIKKRVKKI